MKLVLAGIFVSVLAVVDVQLLSAQSPTEDFPNSMLGFLEPGTHVRVSYRNSRQGDREEHFSVHIFDDVGWQIANDAKSLSLAELRRKYPAVESFALERIAEHEKRLQQPNAKPPEGKRFSEPEISMVVDHSLLCTVIYTGEDYVLVSNGDGEAKRRVLPKHMINQIVWDDGIPSMPISSNYVDADETEPNSTR